MDPLRYLPSRLLDQAQRGYKAQVKARQSSGAGRHRGRDPSGRREAQDGGRVVVGLDPADGTADGAEQALVVAAFGLDRQFYVLHSEGRRDTPLEWLMRAVEVAREYGAARLV